MLTVSEHIGQSLMRLIFSSKLTFLAAPSRVAMVEITEGIGGSLVGLEGGALGVSGGDGEDAVDDEVWERGGFGGGGEVAMMLMLEMFAAGDRGTGSGKGLWQMRGVETDL